jgi:adenylate cyclase
MDIQQALRTRNADLPLERRMEFRIGINVGDVIVEGPQIYGDGVNIAARVESLAEASGICISGPVYDQVKSKLALQDESLGEQPVKNIAEPVRVYRVKLEPESTSSTVAVARSPSPIEAQPSEVPLPLPQPQMRPRRTLILSGVLLLMAIIVAVQYLSLRPPAPSANIPSEQSQPLPLPDKPSLVVLPLVNLSRDNAQEYFSSELGREAEARAEAAEVLRLNPNFLLDVHKQRMPIKDPATLERYIAALRKAGLK